MLNITFYNNNYSERHAIVTTKNKTQKTLLNASTFHFNVGFDFQSKSRSGKTTGAIKVQM